jgi:hypothetical protein
VDGWCGEFCCDTNPTHPLDYQVIACDGPASLGPPMEYINLNFPVFPML